jgi:hypothetical protein
MGSGGKRSAARGVAWRAAASSRHRTWKLAGGDAALGALLARDPGPRAARTLPWLSVGASGKQEAHTRAVKWAPLPTGGSALAVGPVR